VRGLDVTIERFNGLKELLSRPGIPPLLKDQFFSFNADEFDVNRVSNQAFMDLVYVSTLLLHSNIFNMFSDVDRDALCYRVHDHLVGSDLRHAWRIDESFQVLSTVGQVINVQRRDRDLQKAPQRFTHV